MNLLNLRTILLRILSFTRFLRFSEVINLKCSDIILKETHMSIFIETTKTKVYREGYWKRFYKLHSAFCPMKLFRKYIEAGKTKESKNEAVKPLFLRTCDSTTIKSCIFPPSHFINR